MIRDAVRADFPSILALNTGAVHYTSPLSAARLQHLHDQATYHRVVEADGQVVAFLLAFREGADYDSPNYAWFSGRYDAFVYIDRAVVHESHRRKGLGAALYEDLIRSASEHGVEVLTCEIDISPPNPVSLLFHERYGFRQVGKQWLYNGRKQVSLREKNLSVDTDRFMHPGDAVGQGHPSAHSENMRGAKQ